MKTLTDDSADEALAVAVVEVAREASTEATGELVTPDALQYGARSARIPPSLAWSGIAIAAVVVAALPVPRLTLTVPAGPMTEEQRQAILGSTCGIGAHNGSANAKRTIGGPAPMKGAGPGLRLPQRHLGTIRPKV